MMVRNYAVRTCVVGLTVWLVAGGGPALGQPAQPVLAPATRPADGAPADGADMTTAVRTYNIGDLVRTVPDYPLPPTAGELVSDKGRGSGGAGLYGGSGGGGEGAEGVEERVDGLIRLIQEFVAADTWREAGGSVGAIRRLDPNLLVITQTEANHRAVQALLDTVRRDTAAGAIVEVEARWVLLTPDQADAWRAAERKGGTDGGEAVRALAREVSRDETSLYCRATTLCFNGQTVGVTSGRSATVVTGANPTVGQAFGLYQIETGRERSGVSLQVMPWFAPDRGTVTVDVYSVVAEDVPAGGPADRPAAPAAAPAMGAAGPRSPETRPASGEPVGDATRQVVAALERPARHEQRFRTTVRVRPGTPAIVGGMTQEPGKPGSRQLCLLIDARAIESPAQAAEAGRPAPAR